MSATGEVIAHREYGPYRSGNERTTVTLELRQREDGRIYASFIGETFEGRRLEPVSAGQTQAHVPSALVAIWDRWHLNDMKAGCPHQESLFHESPADRPTCANDYRGASGIELSPNPNSACPDCGYKYGSAWNFEPLPESFLLLCDEAARS